MTKKRRSLKKRKRGPLPPKPPRRKVKKATKRKDPPNTVELEEINLSEAPEEWQVETKELSAEQKASLEVARYVLAIFAGVYLLCFAVAIAMLYCVDGTTFDQVIEIIKYMLGSVIPLATLAVGFYLGDKSRS